MSQQPKMTIQQPMDLLRSYSLLDDTDLVQDDLREALSVLVTSKIDDVYGNLARALRTAREVRERSR